MNITANIDNIKEQINRKKDSKPYFSTKENVRGVVTDYDHFPYRRFYRGKPESNKPVVIEREAGWRKGRSGCWRGRFGLDLRWHSGIRRWFS